MNSWYERAVKEIEKDYVDGLMSDSEYQIAMRDLDQEFREYAQQEAEQYYNSLMAGERW